MTVKDLRGKDRRRQHLHKRQEAALREASSTGVSSRPGGGGGLSRKRTRKGHKPRWADLVSEEVGSASWAAVAAKPPTPPLVAKPAPGGDVRSPSPPRVSMPTSPPLEVALPRPAVLGDHLMLLSLPKGKKKVASPEAVRLAAATAAAAVLSTAFMGHLFPVPTRGEEVVSEGGGPAGDGALPAPVASGLQAFLTSQLAGVLVRESPEASPLALPRPVVAPDRRRSGGRAPAARALDVSWALTDDQQPTEAVWKLFCGKVVPGWLRGVTRESRDSGLCPLARCLMAAVQRLPCTRPHLAKTLAEVCTDYGSRAAAAAAMAVAATPTGATRGLPEAVPLGRRSAPTPAAAPPATTHTSTVDDEDGTFLFSMLLTLTGAAKATAPTLPDSSWLNCQVELLVRAATGLLPVATAGDECRALSMAVKDLLPGRRDLAQFFLRRLVSTWPADAAAQLGALQITQEVLLDCPPADVGGSRHCRALLSKVFGCLTSHHAGLARAAVTLCSKFLVLVNYVLHDAAAMAKLTAGLQANRDHWCPAIVSLSERTYDCILDLN